MADVDLKALVGRLNPACKRALETAAGICVSRTHYEVGVEHVLQAILDDPSGDVQLILKHYGVEPGRVSKAVVAVIEGFKAGNPGRPVFSPILLDWFQLAYLLASIEHGQAEVRSGNLLEALIAKPARLAADDYPELLAPIGREDLRKNFDAIVGGSSETAKRAVAADAGGAAAAPGTAEDSGLKKYCTNFTERARAGQLDPVFGRDAEIRQIVDILARRRKNNPIAVGDPGVGKTALVEGLALRIAEGDVPEMLLGTELFGLDMGLLQAGASVKGEFEKRLKQVIEEVKASPKPIIMFIDEAHTLIGAGGQAGGGDAANLLKPALARGELRTVAATTWSEYKKYFEKDPALARRFQLVKVDEPSDEDATTMLRGLKDRYEKGHGVVIRDEALRACAALGSRYIAGRQHPDKGVDLMDTAAARVKIAVACKPGELEDQEREIAALERELEALRRDAAHGAAGTEERQGEVEARVAALKDAVVSGTARWKKEQEAALAVMACRKELAEAKGPAEADARKRLDEAMRALEAARDGETKVPLEVTADVVASVIADWTGIPIGNMIKDEAATLLRFEQEMTSRVKGQDHCHKVVGEGIRAAKAGLKDPEQPMGIFLFVGPSGVGKTETALGVADLLFGGERFMTTINMSEFQEKHTVSRLIGSPPGYVGYGEGGMLTEAVRQRPYSVVLLDECEKADPDVLNLFYQVFDKGKLNDGEGREVDFKDTVIFLTSNLATDLITEAGLEDPPPSVEDLVALIRPALSKYFKPALLARMTIVPFYPLKQDALRMITRLKLGKLQRRLASQHKMTMDITDAVVDAIAARCTEVETGARNVDHILRGTLLPRISTEILTQMSVGPLPPRLTLGIGEDGAFTFAFGD
ncbi:MAG: type VI secretion system ATPase TssH [Planctomycetota bacterium]|nr:type VI secretion system ATPase TssH [Planctomycetota bacterium]